MGDATEFLNQIGLGVYATALEQQGYTTVEALKAADERTLVQLLKKPGHVFKLRLKLGEFDVYGDGDKSRRLGRAAASIGLTRALAMKLLVIGFLMCVIAVQVEKKRMVADSSTHEYEVDEASQAPTPATHTGLVLQVKQLPPPGSASSKAHLAPEVNEWRARELKALPPNSTLEAKILNRVFDSLLSNGDEYEYNKFYHLHIPKVGGSSFRKDVPRIVPTSAELITLERCFYDGIAEADHVLTLVRRPKRHVLSQYTHCATSGSHNYGKDWIPQFADWVAGWYWLRQQGKLSAFCCTSPVDMQSYRMTCPAKSMSAGRQKRRFMEVDINEAIKNLKEMYFVGLLDAYDESICLLQARVRGELPTYCNCEVDALWKRRPQLHIDNHGVHHANAKEHHDQTMELVDSITLGDIKLYNAAVDRFLTEVRIVEKHYGRKFMCKHIEPLPVPEVLSNRSEKFFRDVSRRMKHYMEFLPRQSPRKELCARRYGQMVEGVTGNG